MALLHLSLKAEQRFTVLSLRPPGKKMGLVYAALSRLLSVMQLRGIRKAVWGLPLESLLIVATNQTYGLVTSNVTSLASALATQRGCNSVFENI